eukprot:gene7958-1174_t
MTITCSPRYFCQRPHLALIPIAWGVNISFGAPIVLKFAGLTWISIDLTSTSPLIANIARNLQKIANFELVTTALLFRSFGKTWRRGLHQHAQGRVTPGGQLLLSGRAASPVREAGWQPKSAPLAGTNTRANARCPNIVAKHHATRPLHQTQKRPIIHNHYLVTSIGNSFTPNRLVATKLPISELPIRLTKMKTGEKIPAPGSGKDQVGPMFRVLINIDITGSMSNEIEGVKVMVAQFVTFLETMSVPLLFAIVTFTEDSQGCYVSLNEFTSLQDTLAFVGNIKLCRPPDHPSVHASGEDGDENQKAALHRLIDLDPLPTVGFLITDALPHLGAYNMQGTTARKELSWLQNRGVDSETARDFFRVLGLVKEHFQGLLVMNCVIYNHAPGNKVYGSVAQETGGMLMIPRSRTADVLAQGMLHVVMTVLNQLGGVSSDKVTELAGFDLFDLSGLSYRETEADPAGEMSLGDNNTIFCSSVFRTIQVGPDRVPMEQLVHTLCLIHRCPAKSLAHKLKHEGLATPANPLSKLVAVAARLAPGTDQQKSVLQLFLNERVAIKVQKHYGKRTPENDEKYIDSLMQYIPLEAPLPGSERGIQPTSELHVLELDYKATVKKSVPSSRLLGIPEAGTRSADGDVESVDPAGLSRGEPSLVFPPSNLPPPCTRLKCGDEATDANVGAHSATKGPNPRRGRVTPLSHAWSRPPEQAQGAGLKGSFSCSSLGEAHSRTRGALP